VQTVFVGQVAPVEIARVFRLIDLRKVEASDCYQELEGSTMK
jgi:hypothetical protein